MMSSQYPLAGRSNPPLAQKGLSILLGSEMFGTSSYPFPTSNPFIHLNDQAHLPDYWFVFDVETLGLHGEAFAAAYTMINRKGGGSIFRGLGLPSRKC